MDLSRAYRIHKKELQILTENCEKIAHEVNSALEDTKSAVEKLAGATASTSKAVDFAKQQALSEFKNQLEKGSLKAKEEIRKWRSDTSRMLSESEDTLKCQKARLDNAITMASQITKIGSPFDISSAYSVLYDTLDQLSKLTTPKLPSRISNVEFIPSTISCEVPSLGTLVAGSRGHTQEVEIQDATMSDAKGITVALSGDIVVAEFKPNQQDRVPMDCPGKPTRSLLCIDVRSVCNRLRQRREIESSDKTNGTVQSISQLPNTRSSWVSHRQGRHGLHWRRQTQFHQHTRAEW